MVMSSIFNSGPSFFRSRSSPNIPELAKVDPQAPAKTTPRGDLPRAASYTFLPTGRANDFGRGPADKDVLYKAEDADQTTDEREGRAADQSTKEVARTASVGRRKSLVARPKSWMQKARGTPEPAEENGTGSKAVAAVEIPALPTMPKAVRENRRKSVSESLATFARKSWIGTSRSPSPSRSPSHTSLKQATKLESVEGQRAGDKPTLNQPPLPKVTGSPQKPQPVKRSTLQKLKRPQSVLMTFTNLTSANSSTSSLPSSLENKSTPRTSIEKIPPVPKTFSSEKLLHGIDGYKKRDELWAAFRSLDNDFAKFQSKSWSLKTNIVRTAVLPFFKNHASHPSNISLRPEDLERRVAVLNKWWAGLLEVLDGRQNQTVSGVDRPILLEACYCIMVRPEWRASLSTNETLSAHPSQSSTHPSLRTKPSFASIRSTSSLFVTESIFHTTRTYFIQNLLTQAAFVVAKMSLRHAPSSLTTFCGKAMAYAFYFVPGVADVLVRVWKLNAETLRRVIEELGLPLGVDVAATDEVASTFPAHLRSLGWTSPKKMAASLRQNAQLSIIASKIKWYGPWAGRWCGRDSDLFFVFVKHYFILCEELLPPDLPLITKCRAPGFVLVQAQLMVALDATTHRQQQQPEGPPITFDDVLGGADAIAAALPLPSNNSARPMAENRLIMLLRDFLSEHSVEFGAARSTFAEVFSKTLQASARKTSLYDHHACFVLCDFLEEALQIYIRFQTTNPLELDQIDWYFWLEVCKKVLESQNTMSEIRLFALIYGSWSTLTATNSRKEVITLDWLLTEETFTKFFCHWCPMVRAYYMRLLCWRLCRDDGEASVLDTKIFSVASSRLKTIFAHYLFIKQSVMDSETQPLSTVPCHPAPGRRFLIIRNDFQAPAANIFMGFDGIIPPNPSSAAPTLTPFKRHSLQFGPQPDATSADASPAKDTKKRWSILGKSFSSFEAQSPTASPPVTPSSSPPKNLDEVRRETAAARSSRPSLQRASSSATRTRSEPPASYRLYCFKFSLEWAQNFERINNRANQERRIVSPRLPSPAQACIGARIPGTGREVLPCDPGSQLKGVKYAGRALAEWAVIVGECNSFVERRRSEGIPGLKLVEVPVLGVEGFRKFGG